MDNPAYKNQKVYCETHNIPLFASEGCSHEYPWMRKEPEYGVYQTLTEMLKRREGNTNPLLGGTHHITGCPICHRSWCD